MRLSFGHFQYDKSESIHKNANYPSTDYLDTWSQIGKDDGDKKVDLYVTFGKDSSYYGTVGLAWVGGACNDYIKTSFNEYRNTPSETAMVNTFTIFIHNTYNYNILSFLRLCLTHYIKRSQHMKWDTTLVCRMTLMLSMEVTMAPATDKVS